MDAATYGDGPAWHGASGEIVATAADTARFAHALFTGSLLPPRPSSRFSTSRLPGACQAATTARARA